MDVETLPGCAANRSPALLRRTVHSPAAQRRRSHGADAGGQSHGARLLSAGGALPSPPPIADEILYAAQLCGVKKVFNVGGAQAIAALPRHRSRCRRWIKSSARATLTSRSQTPSASVWTARPSTYQQARRKCWSSPTAAPTRLCRLRPAVAGGTRPGLAGDPPDPGRRHGQPRRRSRGAPELPCRAETARVALSASRIIVARDLAQCVAISNQYGPEHLIIQTRQARELVDSITSAGSVFLATGRRNRLATTPRAPTTSCRPTVTHPTAPASAWPTSRSG